MSFIITKTVPAPILLRKKIIKSAIKLSWYVYFGLNSELVRIHFSQSLSIKEKSYKETSNLIKYNDIYTDYTV